MHNYNGNPASYPTTIPLIDDSDAPTASVFNPGPEALADRAAWLKANCLLLSGGAVTGPIVLSTGASIDLTGTASVIVETTAKITVNGLVEIVSGAALQFDVGSFLNGTVSAGVAHFAGNQVTLDNIGSLVANHNQSIQAAVSGGIVPLVAGGIASPVAGGITASVSGGITTSVTQGIASAVTLGIVATAPSALGSSVPGGIGFGGGPTDYGTLTPPRSKSYSFFPAPVTSEALDGTNWGQSTAFGHLPLRGAATGFAIDLRLECPHDGATLTTVAVTFVVNTAHGSIPAVMPTIAVFAQPIAPGGLLSAALPLSTVSPQSDATVPQAYPTPANGAGWYHAAQVQTMTFTCNVNNTIDNANNVYFLRITDETGAGSVAGNFYVAVTCNYTSITDLRFAS